MEQVLNQPRQASIGARAKLPSQAVAASWTLGFAVPLYLALRGGGYDVVLRDQVGIALWWIVLLGALVGVLPARRATRAQLLLLGALVVFAVWTGIGAFWSLNSEHTIAELTRLSTYAAILTLGVVAVRSSARSVLVGGISTAIVVVALLALLSRLHPAWFGANQTAEYLTTARSRLNYPLNYWNALAALTAIGIPMVVHFAWSARNQVMRVLAAAAIPMMAGTIYLTFSRGGWIEVGAALLVYVALTPGRLWRLATLSIGALASALFIAAIHERPAVDNGLLGTAAHHGGNELIAIGVVICLAVGLLQLALVLVERHADRPEVLTRIVRPQVWQPIAIVMIAMVAFFAFGGPHELSHLGNEFKNPHLQVAAGQESAAGRLNAASGEGRYQFWTAALHAFSSHPVGGIGAGTFQFWWAAHGSIYAYIINAHSLYFETLAETGLPGLLLLLSVLLGGFIVMIVRWFRAPSHERMLLACMLGALAAFLVSAGFDWVWQIPALPAIALLLIAAGAGNIFGGQDERARRHQTSVKSRVTWAALAVIGALVIVVPMMAAVSVRESQAQAGQAHLSSALQDARTAEHWQPYAATPPLQQALVLERARNFTAAASKARSAIRAGSTDWTTWLVLSRIEAERGNAEAAVAAYRHARSLDPRNPIFKQT